MPSITMPANRPSLRPQMSGSCPCLARTFLPRPCYGETILWQMTKADIRAISVELIAAVPPPIVAARLCYTYSRATDSRT